MLIIDAKDCENIDQALKKYKKKFEKSRTLLQLRSRQAFVKPSVRRRTDIPAMDTEAQQSRHGRRTFTPETRP